MDDLKREIIEEVKRFNLSQTRDEKRRILQHRRNDYLRSNFDLLEKQFSDIVSLNAKFDINRVSPRLKVCSTKEETSLWNYFRSVVSSLPNTGYYGRNLKFFLVDSSSGTCMGILGLGSDFMNLPSRDSYIGWNRKDKFGQKYKGDQIYTGSFTSWVEQKRAGVTIKNNKINNLMNIHTCVSLEPFNTIKTGKLLAMMAFSDKILDEFEKKYNQKLAGITTTSVYGKSIQYSGISDFMKFMGMSKGESTHQFPESIVRKCREYYEKNRKSKNWMEFTLLGLQPKSKMINLVCRDIGIKPSEIKGNHQKGVYFGYTHVNSRDFLTGRNGHYITENRLKRFNRSEESIVNEWKKRFLSEDRIKSFVNKPSPYHINDIRRNINAR